MGMYSILVLRNDVLHTIRDDSFFGIKVYDAVAMWPHGPRHVGALSYAGHVASVGHADHEQLVSVWRGVGEPLPLDEQEALFRYRQRKAAKEKRRRGQTVSAAPEETRW